ncbi:hypothetical protein QTO34_007128 [Cnephaeus nilssonii]|uniref:MIT domain-containing protein n=1 Tax=Cnephaeus nilssonii TaxID=3371016 RepID=A0AA40HKS2_CNENI|nr:hypothetical protein QTO34_007128 [Eptesicus nilssonii]
MEQTLSSSRRWRHELSVPPAQSATPATLSPTPPPRLLANRGHSEDGESVLGPTWYFRPNPGSRGGHVRALHAGMAPPTSLNSREESGLRCPSPRETPEGQAALAQCGRKLRWPFLGAPKSWPRLPGAPRSAKRLCVRASLPRQVRGLGAMDSSALERDAVQFARLAVQRDHEGRYAEAVFYYKEAAQALIYAEMAGSSLEHIQEKISEYLERVQALHSAG